MYTYYLLINALRKHIKLKAEAFKNAAANPRNQANEVPGSLE
jgi:hypothetical protein